MASHPGVVVFQAMRQLEAGPSGIAFLGATGEALSMLVPGVMARRQLNPFTRVPDTYAENRPQIQRMISGVMVGGQKLQPLSNIRGPNTGFSYPVA